MVVTGVRAALWPRQGQLWGFEATEGQRKARGNRHRVGPGEGEVQWEAIGCTSAAL